MEKTKILLVDDESDVTRILSKRLGRRGYDCQAAANGQEAVDAMGQFAFGVIIMDVKMPVMDGLEATRVIRGISPTVPIIAQTANAFEADHKAALDAGCNDIITKPIKSSTLRLAINKYLTNN